MDKYRIRSLINFDDEGEDTSTGYVSASGGPGIDEELTEILSAAVNTGGSGKEILVLNDIRWSNVLIEDYTFIAKTDGDVVLTVSRDVDVPVRIMLNLHNLLRVIPGIRRFVIDCDFEYDNSLLEIRYFTKTKEPIEFFEKHMWFRSGTPHILSVGPYTTLESVRGGEVYVPDYDPFSRCPEKLTTNFLK